MPPIIHSNLNPGDERRPQKPVEKRSELVCRVKYCNTLPDIPFDPKFITYPFETTRFIEYKPTSLERNYKYEVLTEHDLGVTIDLINRDTYAIDYNAVLDPADEKLLEEDILTPQDSKRSRHHAKSVSWLRRTEYISTEQTRFQPQVMDKVEAAVGYRIKKTFPPIADAMVMDKGAQIKAIDKTFQDSQIPIEKHYSRPNVVPVEVQPLLPDFMVWKYPCAQVIFDSDPAPTGRTVPAQIEEMSQAMIRGVMDESGEQFVAYFLPTEETLQKRRNDCANGVPYTDDEEYVYKMAREYNWNVKSKANKGYEENYFFVLRKDGIYFNELETRVRLNKRRQKPGQAVNNTKLVVKHVPLNAQEFKMQRNRERQLEPPIEDEEEDEEEDDEEEMEQDEQAEQSQEVETANNKSDDDAKSGDEAVDNKDNDASGDDKSGSDEGEKSDEENKNDAESVASSKSRSRSSSGSRSRSGSRSPARSKSRSSSRSQSRVPKSGPTSPAGSERSRRSSPAGSEKSSRTSPAGSEKSSSEVSGPASPAGSEKSGPTSPAGSVRSGLISPAGSERSGPTSAVASERSGPPSPAASGRSGPPSPAASGRSGPPSPAASGRSGPPSLAASVRSGPPSPAASGRSGAGTATSGSNHSSPPGSPRSPGTPGGASVRRSRSRSGSSASSSGSSGSGSESDSQSE